jgi:hypothetical protein
MKHINFNDPHSKKKVFIVDIDQLSVIETLYNKGINKEFEDEIKKKLNAYKSQDKLKHKFNEELIITYDQIITKLYESKLKCYYCLCDMVILYNKKRQNTQWTLERLNNNIGHYDSNTCISCLKCNLQRRTDNYEYFKQGKQIKINIIK